MAKNELRDCFRSAIKGDSIGKKHKGLLIKKPDDKLARKYLAEVRKINPESAAKLQATYPVLK